MGIIIFYNNYLLYKYDFLINYCRDINFVSLEYVLLLF